MQPLPATSKRPMLPTLLLGVSIACAVGVVVLGAIAGAGLLVRMLVWVFMAGTVTSASAWVLSVRHSALYRVRRTAAMMFALYAAVAAWVVGWFLVVRPPFG